MKALDEESEDAFVLALIQDLALSKWDFVLKQTRNDTVKLVKQFLSEKPKSRKVFAEAGDLRCTSQAAYKRVANLFCTAILCEVEDLDTRKTLCLRLCSLLKNSKDGNLLEECKRTVLAAAKVSAGEDGNMESTFIKIASDNEASLGIPAIAFASAVDWSLFFKLAYNSDPIASAGDMELCQFILKDMDKAVWEDIVGNAAILKLKAKPESVLNVMEVMMRYVNPFAIATSQIVITEYLAFLTKTLKSPRESVRNNSSLILQHISEAAIKVLITPSGEDSDKAKTCIVELLTGISDTKTLAQPHQRQIVYDTLFQIGSRATGDASDNNKRTAQVEPCVFPVGSDVLSFVLNGICTSLSKEAKAATEIREIGIRALVVWMVIAKRNAADCTSGYEESLAFLRKPVVAENGGDTITVVGRMVQDIDPNSLEQIVLDLWKDAKFAKGLDSFIKEGNKKQATSSSIPPVEGLLAIYLNLVYANVSSSQPSSLVETALSSGSVPVQKTSFVYGLAVTTTLLTNSLVGRILPEIIAIYSKISADSGSKSTKMKKSSARVRALACCIVHPRGIGRLSPAESIETIVRTVLEYEEISEYLVLALFNRVNELSLEYTKSLESQNASRQAREEAKSLSIKGKGNPTASHGGVCVGSVRRLSRSLSVRPLSRPALTKALTMMHGGTSVRAKGQQRDVLVKNTTEVLRILCEIQWDQKEELFDLMSRTISEQASSVMGSDGIPISEAVHVASQSLIVSLGIVACKFSPLTDDPDDDEMKPFAFAMEMLTNGVSQRLSEQLSELIENIQILSITDVGLLQSPVGTLYEVNADENPSRIDIEESRKARRTENEEWELEIKREITKKKIGVAENTPSLSSAHKKIIQEQDINRENLKSLLDTSFHRTLASVETLVSTDIEIGNSCLPTLSGNVLRMAILDCPATMEIGYLRDDALKVLTSVASCVFEIQEEYAPMIALALTISCRNGLLVKDGTQSNEKVGGLLDLDIAPLPSPCEPAAVTVFEMDEFQDELSGASFGFLFPVIRAALMGPRTTPGCEGALRVLHRHTMLLAGEKCDPNVKTLRSDMATSVLELLKHDRSQAFTDPNPYETLVACYQTDADQSSGAALSTAELAPLLDERGALGGRNCRMAAMIALGSIAKRHQRLIKNNPLIENRIWLNCFDTHDPLRSEARNSWKLMHGHDEGNPDLSPPSAMYSIPLLALLQNTDKSIAAAAAAAYSHGMKAHPNTLNRNIEKLCSTYIDSFPAPGDCEESSSVSSIAAKNTQPKVAPVVAKKPAVTTGLKKKVIKKNALQVAGIGQPKKKTAKKKSAVASALLNPKQERTMDQATLDNQFKTGLQKTPLEVDSPEKASVRLGILNAMGAIPSVGLDMDFETLSLLTGFLMAYGIADGNADVSNASRKTLCDVITAVGSSDKAITFLMSHLDHILKTGSTINESLGNLLTSKIPKGAIASDRRKQGAVVALGSVASHLNGPENVSKIDSSVDMLLASLNTTNEDVRSSVADALSKLMKKGSTQERVEGIFEQLLHSCLHGESTSIRRGGAYGISAAVKGSGIATLKKYNVVNQLEEACSSGCSTSKDGSLFAIQLLCTSLGLLFEPYVIVLLPSLLKCFGDASETVRRAASVAVGVVMSKLSAHGVKLVLPAVLSSFNDSSWRTKQASINMLGSMSHLAPKQLASALPKVVPKLTEAFADTHPKVKASAQAALDEISSVIRNPEIHDISQVLLKALTDPAENTLPALEALIATEFLHAIDAPSLALIVPILHRGLRDRAAATKRYGALITGNICTMINDPRDFIPYLPTLMPDLKSSLLDPIPDVRAIAAKALGSLTRGLGEDSLVDLRPWLIEHLRKDGLSSAERSGAAQGLTEVLVASGTSVVESVMLDEILPLSSHPSSATREGVLWVLCFLPPALGQGFTSLLDDTLPPLINGLSDENEQVREVALRAGRVLIKSHGKVHFDKILPILQSGMADVDFRIRLSALMLLGDLLSMLGNTSLLRTDGDTQDDIRRAERAQAQITLVLGIQTRNRVLSDVYLARSDTAIAVRQAAVQVWKTVVSVTARTLRQILQTLVDRVVSDLASGDVERTEIAGKCLGDIVGKLGDSVLPEIIPVLRNSLYDSDAATKRGVCVGLSEVIGSSNKDQILRFLDIIVKVVQDALCDDDASVRKIAASSFQNLYNLVGNRAMDEVVPSLMVALENTDDAVRRERALNGLTGILSIRSKELLPYIIPRLIEQPITENHAKALSRIASVTSTTLYFHFRTIVPGLLLHLGVGPGYRKESDNSVRECARSICRYADEAGLHLLISEIAGKCTSDKPEIRMESCWMLGIFVEERTDHKDFYDQVSVIIRELIQRFNDDYMEVVNAANKAFGLLSKYVPAEELAKDIEYMRNLINSMVSDARRRKGGVGDGEFLLPGFNIPKGVEPLLPIYQRGILYGSPTIREASAAGLGEIINLTSSKYLAGPLIIKMTGPLLRIVGDRNPSNVKIAILRTLGLILVKGGPALRAFVPQFQTTFVKALSDPSRQVRVEAISAFGLLMPLSTRVDPLIKELVSGSLGKGAMGGDETGATGVVQTATLEALAVVLEKGGKKSKLPDGIPSALEASFILIRHSDDSVREAAAKVMGISCDLLGVTKTEHVIQDNILESHEDDSADVRHGKACAIRRILSTNVGKQLGDLVSANVRNLASQYVKDDTLSVQEAGVVAVGAAVGRSSDPVATLRSIEPDLLALMGDLKQRLETHQAVARCLALALQFSDVPSRVSFFGPTLLGACLKLAMSGSQRVQFSFNDVLWLALDVSEGQAGLDEFCSIAMFEDSRQMKSLHSKVLVKIKNITILDD